MATYIELCDFIRGSQAEGLTKKVEVALTVKAVGFLVGTPTAAQKAWASACLQNPEAYIIPVVRAVVAYNRTLTVAQLAYAPEGEVQTQVDAVVDKVFIG